MEDSFNCELVSWDHIYELSKTVARNIRQSGFQPDILVGLARGGLVPTRNLSDLLGVKDVISIKVEHWGEVATKDGKVELKYPIKTDLTGKKVLIVDDITDTGESIRVAKDYVQSLGPAEIRTAVLKHIFHSKFVPDFYADELKEWKWIIFPWCFVEDVGSLIGKVLDNGGGMNLESIRQEIERRFAVKLEDEYLMDAVRELEYRNLIEKTGNDQWRRKS